MTRLAQIACILLGICALVLAATSNDVYKRVALKATKDAQIVRYSKVCPEHKCANLNYGNSESLQFGNYELISDVLLSFRLSPDFIPGSSKIRNAELIIPAPERNTIVGSDTARIDIYAVDPKDKNWNERTVTWNTRPKIDPNRIASFNMSPYGASVNLADLASQIMAAPDRELHLYLRAAQPIFFSIPSKESPVGGVTLHVEFTPSGGFFAISPTYSEIAIGVLLVGLASAWWAYNAFVAERRPVAIVHGQPERMVKVTEKTRITQDNRTQPAVSSGVVESAAAET